MLVTDVPGALHDKKDAQRGAHLIGHCLHDRIVTNDSLLLFIVQMSRRWACMTSLWAISKPTWKTTRLLRPSSILLQRQTLLRNKVSYLVSQLVSLLSLLPGQAARMDEVGSVDNSASLSALL
jgi:hypothetical protein